MNAGHLLTGGLPDWTLVDYIDHGVGLTHPAHRCLLGHMVSYLFCQLHAWPSDEAHT